MTGKQRMIAALEYRETDRVPRFWQSFWDEFIAEWKKRFPDGDINDYFGDDMDVIVADETTWPTKAGVVSESAGERIARNGWGQVQRLRADAHFSETIEVPVSERIDPDKIVFDDPMLESRYAPQDALIQQQKDKGLFIFCKTGGPYLRAAFLRGEEQFWLDLMDDPGWSRAFIDRVADHLAMVGCESIRRWGLQDSGIAIFDDCAASWGPFVGADLYERFFLPALERMVKAYRAAGARFIMHHSDGNVIPLLDMWVDIGIDAINPVEYRSGMDAVKLREQYGNRLAMIGGLDNCAILPRGDRGEIRDHVLHILEAARGGGFVLGTHSIGPDISVDTMLYALELVEQYGNYPLAGSRATQSV